MSIAKKLMIQPVSGGVAPAGVEFEGDTSHFRRDISSLPNNMTLSFWFYVGSSSFQQIYSYQFTSGLPGLAIRTANNSLDFTFYNSNGGQTESGSGSVQIALYQWHHVVVSVNKTTSGSATIYLDDENRGTINFSQDSLGVIERDLIARVQAGTYAGYGEVRIAHFYMDSSLRDLSVQATRRLFITDDLKPAPDQASLNPTIYLPMTDVDTAHINQGTGIDYTQFGSPLQADRGPNQTNTFIKNFDGSNDHISGTSNALGVTSNKLFTCSYVARCDTSTQGYIFSFWTGASTYFVAGSIQVSPSNYAYSIQFEGRNSSGTTILRANTPPIPLYKYAHVSFSCDLSDTNKRFCFVDGVDRTADVSWQVYTNDNFHWNGYQYPAIACLDNTPGGGAIQSRWNGALGEVFIDNNYYDLSVDNIFWDDVENAPKGVRKVLEDSGATPMIAMPIQSGSVDSQVAKNYGTFGTAFSINSAPFIGKRSVSEFYPQSAYFDLTGDWLRNSSPVNKPADKKTLTVVGHMHSTDGGDWVLIEMPGVIKIYRQNQSSSLRILGNGGTTLDAQAGANSFNTSTHKFVMFSVDMSDTAKRHLYQNDVSVSVGWSTYANSNLPWSTLSSITVGEGGTTTIGGLYVTDEYIDFSVEANRRKFIDCFGYPVDLQPAIDAGDIPAPYVYLRMEDASNLGANSGSGGDLSVTGTARRGRDFDPNAD